MEKFLFRTLLVVGVAIFMVGGVVSAYGPLNNEHFMDRIEQMVESGKITQEQADERFEKIEEHHETMLENKASILGLSVDELKAKLEQGLAFLEIAEEQGITQDQLREYMKEFRVKRFENCPEGGEGFGRKGPGLGLGWKMGH